MASVSLASKSWLKTWTPKTALPSYPSNSGSNSSTNCVKSELRPVKRDTSLMISSVVGSVTSDAPAIVGNNMNIRRGENSKAEKNAFLHNT